MSRVEDMIERYEDYVWCLGSAVRNTDSCLYDSYIWNRGNLTGSSRNKLMTVWPLHMYVGNAMAIFMVLYNILAWI
jgi:hypothetical protein